MVADVFWEGPQTTDTITQGCHSPEIPVVIEMNEVIRTFCMQHKPIYVVK